MAQFELVSEYVPQGDQPQAIAALAAGLSGGLKDQVLLGITGSGKTYVMAQVIEQVQRPALVIAPNKTLAAQLCGEFREFFPGNAVEFFVSYYDYYQPEAYLPQTDTYIEKDSAINDEIERLRHAATQSVMSRTDSIIVASVSCIFGLGSPEAYREIVLNIYRDQHIEREAILRQLIQMQFTRNDVKPGRGQFRARGDVVEIHPVDRDELVRLEMYGDDVERILVLDELTGEITEERQQALIFSASHYVVSPGRVESALGSIEAELEERLRYFQDRGRLLEAQRLEQRTLHDLEMIREVGYCTGIENYSRHFDGRAPGDPPYTLLDYFPDNYVTIIDESHQTIPQIRAMWAGDHSRKNMLVEHGFRLPSAYDNRPLTFDEWEARAGQVMYTSATPGPYELGRAQQMAELIVRPTGLIDPVVEVRPTAGQIDDLIGEIQDRVARGQRVLVTTLTKRMAEDLSEYMADLGIRVNYMHSDVATIERTELLRDLRMGAYDVLVGINLLREGLDLPEVSLVAILDADREGFLRSETSLIQTMGRAARHLDGKVIMYADRRTAAMEAALGESERRRAKQTTYNEEHGITPQSVTKAIRETIRSAEMREEKVKTEIAPELLEAGGEEVEEILAALEAEMGEAAERLDFERAAEIRDEIKELRALLADEAG
ncbi:MAG TPA: excinuclease ABC subunit UvrB [Armatimonadota bacterium]|jgi:excinuclease ABC subunit B